VAQNQLDHASRTAIENAEVVYVSAASIWEIEIKRSLGRLHAPGDLISSLEDSGYERLAITFEHASEAGRLPPLHRDPFDRMLAAQARLEGMSLATGDDAVKRYEVQVLEMRRADSPRA
jgi:PIN domain nuclease of toxin-antitoxin system